MPQSTPSSWQFPGVPILESPSREWLSSRQLQLAIAGLGTAFFTLLMAVDESISIKLLISVAVALMLAVVYLLEKLAEISKSLESLQGQVTRISGGDSAFHEHPGHGQD